MYLILYIYIYIPPRFNKIKHCYNNIIKRKTRLSFRYMFFFSLATRNYDIPLIWI